MGRDYRIPAVDDEDAELAWAVIVPIWYLHTAADGDSRLPRAWDDVTRGQMHVYAVTWVEREVNNGGFWQYLYNASADLPVRALEGFKAIGAKDYAMLLKRAMSIYPDGALPTTRKARMAFLPEDPTDDDLRPRDRAILDELSALDDAFYDLYGDGEQYYARIAKYVREHPAEFFR